MMYMIYSHTPIKISSHSKY